MVGQTRIPYADGMTEGQGYNSYLQQTCVHDAVTVEATDGPDSPMDLIYQSSEIKDYNELLQTLDISAGAGVAGWGTDTKIDSKFLDRTEKSLLTYVVKVDAQRQPSAKSKYTFNWTSPPNPQGKYGDSFISNFIKGGALFARVSIMTNEKSTSHELQVAAKTAFTVYGANTEVTTEVKESMEKIQKSSEVKIYLHYVGAPAKMQSKDGAENNMMRLKEVADSFYNDAPKHTYKRFALLEKYTNIPNFNSAFLPLNYTEAKERLDNKVSTQLQLYRTWVDEVSKQPQKAESAPPSDFPTKLQTEVLLAVKRRQYFAQSIHLSNGLRTHFIDDHKHATTKQLFSFEAYDFGQIMGTTKIIFGRRTNEDKYVCLMGRTSISPGYKQMSQLWGFEEKAKDVVDGEVVIDPILQMGIISLELQDAAPRRDDDLSFYVKRI
ncbi:hypothetical protein PG988_010552 [Apiospora saccharicola]